MKRPKKDLTRVPKVRQNARGGAAMRVNVTLPKPLADKVQETIDEDEIRSMSQAIVALVRRGLETGEQENGQAARRRAG